MGIPRKEVFPRGIKRRRHPVVARSHFKVLDKSNIAELDNNNITQGIKAGTNKLLEKTRSGILSSIKAGRDI